MSEVAAAFRGECAVELLDCIGTEQFDFVFERMLHSLCGPVQFASYRSREGKLTRIAGQLNEAKALHAIADFDSLARDAANDGKAAQVIARHGTAVLRGMHGALAIWIVVDCESNAPMPAHALDALSKRSGLLLAAHAKHMELLDAHQGAIRAIGSIDRIQECLTASGALRVREIEVCARIIYGLSTLGIAVDLSLGEETVRTYRKRAYQRLALGTERQLLTWYLRQWTHWNTRARA
jgi:DNA-binding CsgD family transcriptional regulator